MRKIRVWLALVLTALLCMAAVIAQADTFAFAEKNVTLFEGRQMSRKVSRGSAGEYHADEQAVVARFSWRVSGR